MCNELEFTRYEDEEKQKHCKRVTNKIEGLEKGTLELFDSQNFQSFIKKIKNDEELIEKFKSFDNKKFTEGIFKDQSLLDVINMVINELKEDANKYNGDRLKEHI